MTEQARVVVFEFFLMVAAAWFVYSSLYKRVRLDAFREELFTVRDDLFDFVWQRGLSYDERAYGMLRSSLNGMIRSAEDGSFNLMTFWVYMRLVNDSGAGAEKVTKAIAAVEDLEARKHFEQVNERIGMIGLRQIWLEGPLSLVLTPIMIWRLDAWSQRNEEVVEVGIELDRREKEKLVPQAA